MCIRDRDVVASTIENSDVNGCVGGYSVLADGRDDKNQKLGKAGGFIGEMSGTIIKNSDANLFNYIIAVSYTHLDVYKRQLQRYRMKWEFQEDILRKCFQN